MVRKYFVYIVTNTYRTTIYIGITNDILRRLSQHYFDSENTKNLCREIWLYLLSIL